MFDDPPASDHCLPIAPFQQKVHRVALSIGVLPPNTRVCHLHGLEQVGTEIFCISGRHAQGRRKEPRFVLPFIMQGIQAIVTELAHVDNCTVGVWYGHTVGVRLA